MKLKHIALGAAAVAIGTSTNPPRRASVRAVDDVDSRELLPALDLAGVEASQGSACSSGTPTPPPVQGRITAS